MEIDTDPKFYQMAYLLAQHADRYPHYYRNKQGQRLTNNLLTQEEIPNERRTRPLHHRQHRTL